MPNTTRTANNNQSSFVIFCISIWARVLAAWGLLLLAVLFLIVFLPAMCTYRVADPKGARIITRICRAITDIWLILVGCTLHIKGRENFEHGKNYIVVYNHNTLLDIVVSYPYCPGGGKTIAKKSFTRIPIFGWFYARGTVLVDRNEKRSRFKSYQGMKKVLRQGLNMCIYPEGTRNRTNKPLANFKDGAFRLATDSGKAIMPTLLFNTKTIMPVNKSFFFLPGPMEMHFLPPIPVGTMTTEELKAKVFKTMWDYYVANEEKLRKRKQRV